MGEKEIIDQLIEEFEKINKKIIELKKQQKLINEIVKKLEGK